MRQATTPLAKYLLATMQMEFWQKIVEYPETAELTYREGVTWKHPNSYYILNTDSITKFVTTHIVVREGGAVYHGFLERHNAVTTISSDPLYYDFDKAYEAFLAPALKEYGEAMKNVELVKQHQQLNPDADPAMYEKTVQLMYRSLVDLCARKGLVQEYQQLKPLLKPELIAEED